MYNVEKIAKKNWNVQEGKEFHGIIPLV